jgi:hypothetical protein
VVRLSVRMEQRGSHWMDFHENWYLSIFLNIRWENSCFITIWQEKRILYMKTKAYLW